MKRVIFLLLIVEGWTSKCAKHEAMKGVAEQMPPISLVTRPEQWLYFSRLFIDLAVVHVVLVVIPTIGD